jgi:ABC-2 type transport system ATP-binding protein
VAQRVRRDRLDVKRWAGVRRGRDVLGQQLTELGLQVRPDGNLLHIAINGEATFDLVRDTTAGLGLGLVRMEQGRHRIEEVFAGSHLPNADHSATTHGKG